MRTASVRSSQTTTTKKMRRRSGMLLHPDEAYELTLDGLHHESESGNVEAPTGWFALLEHDGVWYIVTQDSLGFKQLFTYAQESMARYEYAEMEREYALWDVDPEEEESKLAAWAATQPPDNFVNTLECGHEVDTPIEMHVGETLICSVHGSQKIIDPADPPRS
jgi:hypothetical protein